MSAVWDGDMRLPLAQWEIRHASSERAQAAHSLEMMFACIVDGDWFYAGLWKDKVFGHLQCSDRHVAYAAYLAGVP